MMLESFRKSIVSTLGMKPPGPRSEFFQEWQNGLYITKRNKGISVSFGSRIPVFAAEVGATTFEPPYVIEQRNFCYKAEWATDEFYFTEPAKAMAKLFKILGLPFRYAMPKGEVEQHLRVHFAEVVYGPDKPYRSPFTSDPNDWSRGYTPQPSDVSSTIISYKDGLLYILGFWRQELTGIQVIDVEMVAMNNLEDEPLPEIDLEHPPRSFEAALELLHMEEALRHLRGLAPIPDPQSLVLNEAQSEREKILEERMAALRKNSEKRRAERIQTGKHRP
jgi:hypothetical protein